MAVDLSPYVAAEAGERHKYAADGAMNQYARFVSQQRFARQKEDQTRDYGRQRERFTQPFMRRGVLNSGIYQKALANMVQDRYRQQARGEQDQLQEMQGFDLKDASQASAYQQALLQIALQRQQALNQYNMGMPGASPYTTG
jgi:hypothetical protein